MLARLLPHTRRSPRAIPLAVLLALAASLFASQARSQGLGELTLESALNEPLRASIELLDTGGLEESQVIIGIATPEEYEQAGLERNSLVSQIEFDVELAPGGGGHVILTSQDRIDEPFLSLLVNARWPAGRVLRDYSILLDLPGAATDTAAGTAALSAATAAATATDAYTVQSGDSLWEIAEQTRPGSDVALPQMMIAIQRANEDAFVNNNVNRLINGRVLRIPTRDEIAIIEPAAAVAQVNAQNQAAGLALLGAGAAPGTGAAAVRDELSVLGGDEAAAAGSGSSDLAATIAALEAELMLSEEDLDRARIENEELSARLGDLEEQIAILQNIIAIEDERIAQLQNELAAQAEATDQALSEASRAAEVLAAAGQRPAPQGFTGRVLAQLQNNGLFIGAALAVVLGVLGLLVFRARRAEGIEVEELDLRPAAVPSELMSTHNDEPALIERVLRRLRRGREEDEYPEVGGGSPRPQAHDAERRLDIDVDDTSDELAGDIYGDEDFVPPSTVASPAPLGAGAIREGSPARASDMFAEIDSALRKIDEAKLPELVEADSGQGAVADPLSGLDQAGAEDSPLQAPASFARSDAPPAAAGEVVMDTPVFSAGPESDHVAASFALDPDPEPAPLAADAAVSAAGLVPDRGGVGSRTDRNAEGLDLGSLSFDESDAILADDAELSYSPRGNMDECDTKLDLAVAYEAMGDIDDAIEILDEVIAEGKPAQIEEARRLKAKWQDA